MSKNEIEINGKIEELENAIKNNKSKKEIEKILIELNELLKGYLEN